VDVLDSEGCERDAVVNERVLEGLGRRVRIGFEYQLGPVLLRGRDDRQPAVFTDGEFLLLLKAQDLGIEAKGFVLVVDVDRPLTRAPNGCRPRRNPCGSVSAECRRG
jgi:hypothetical protein